jgi:hypothetical protein
MLTIHEAGENIMSTNKRTVGASNNAGKSMRAAIAFSTMDYAADRLEPRGKKSMKRRDPLAEGDLTER